MATTFGVESAQVLEEVQAVVAGAEAPIEDGQVNGMLVGQLQGRLGIRGGQNRACQSSAGQPLAKRPPYRFLVVHDQNGLGLVCRHVRVSSCFPEILITKKAAGNMVSGGLLFFRPAHEEVARVLEILVKVLLTLVPNDVMEIMHTMMMRANMTAYSTAVGPSSRCTNSVTACLTRVNM